MLPKIHQKLFDWWQQEGRILPWRQRSEAVLTDELAHGVRETAFQSYFAGHLLRDPYRVVVAELMLQQTQVDRVFPKYQAWMKNWPTLANLAQASMAEVLIFWQGLGYNRRARFLWLLAKEITEKRSGRWPETEEELLQLPGIGKYTARAVLSFAMGRQVGVVDTNVKRILQRVVDGIPTAQPRSEKAFFQLADEMLPANQADPWNQALMDFGALICTAKAPKCPICPLKNDCKANQEAIALGYPNYAAYLKKITETQRQNPDQLNRPKKLRFEDTDRYFRGRIMDELRLTHLPPADLRQKMEEQYGLSDQARFQKLLQNLENEGLISKTGSFLQIGSE
jgi:A/G-specific adenine glycosylase